MANKIGISSQLLGNYESGKHQPKLDFFQKWNAAFGEDISEIKISNERSDSLYEDGEPYKKQRVSTSGDNTIMSMLRIIEKQQETIHYLTTGKPQGTMDEKPKKTA